MHGATYANQVRTMNNIVFRPSISNIDRERNNPLTKYPSELTDKEKQLMMNHQRLQELESQIKYYDKKGPYLVGMNSEGAFSFFFPNSGHLGKQAEAKRDEPVFDPDQPQLPLPRYSFAEYFRTKAQKELEQEERNAIEEDEKAAWKRLNDRKNEKENKIIAANQGVSRYYRIKMESLGRTGTRLIVQNFDYLPPTPNDAPKTRRIAVISETTIDHPNLKYRGVNDGLN